MNRMDIDAAALAVFEQAGFGLAVADAETVVIFAVGCLAGLLPRGKAICEAYPPFRGLEQRIADLQNPGAKKLILPAVSLATDESPSEKISLMIAWDHDASAYTICSYPSHDDSEQRLARTLRIKRISSEIIGAGRGAPSQARKGDAQALVSQLSARECEVVALLAAGQPNKGVARLLGLSTKTVEAHRARALKRLNVKTTADLIRIAIEAGIVDKTKS